MFAMARPARALVCTAALLATAAVSRAQQQESGSGSGSGLLLDEGDGGAPPASRVAACFASIKVDAATAGTCSASWSGLVQSARAICLDTTGQCADAAACRAEMAKYSNSLMRLCASAEDKFKAAKPALDRCFSGYDTNGLVDSSNYIDGDIKYHFELLNTAAKCDVLPKMEMIEDVTVNTYAAVRAKQLEACTALKDTTPGTDCAAQEAAHSVAEAVRKYTEHARFQEGQVVGMSVLCGGQDPTYKPEDINECKKSEMIVTRAGLEHCEADCGMFGRPKCKDMEHSHGEACRTAKCTDYLNLLADRHFNRIEAECKNAETFFDKLTETCEGPRHAGELAASASDTSETSEPGGAAATDATRPVFLHGKEPLAFMTRYLAKRCGASQDNLPDASDEFVFLYRRIVNKQLDDCLKDNGENSDKCQDESLAQLRLAYTYPESSAVASLSTLSAVAVAVAMALAIAF